MVPEPFVTAGLWLLAAVLAVFFALLLRESAFVDGEYLPRTNDSFYHARRILDAAVGTRGFYEFDERLQVPEGAWIPWPWAYDYLVSKALQAALWLKPTLDPMAFLVYVPVAWVVVNSGLFVAALRALDLSVGMRFVAVLAFGLSPLVQLQHAIGMVDHHFMELCFTLAAIWLGLNWFRDTSNARAAASLGLVLGVAPAFHNGLFVLQIPVLACAFVSWLRGSSLPRRPALAFAACLVGATLLAALPSRAFREGLFEFALLSWFHLYIAACTTAAVLFMALRRMSARDLSYLTALAAVLAVPILADAYTGARFFSGELTALDRIGEVASPFAMMAGSWGVAQTAGFYSWLIFAAPPLLAYFAWRVVREREGRALYFAVWCVFGLVMLIAQYRFSYFGLFAMITGGLVLLDEASERFRWHRGAAFVGALAAVFLAYQPPLRARLFTRYFPAGDEQYWRTRALHAELKKACDSAPGTVLASADDGNSILFHTECSVIANNFIMRPQDEAKLNEVEELLRSTPDTIRRHDPPIGYLFIRSSELSMIESGRRTIDRNHPMARAFFADPDPPPGFELLYTEEGAGGPDEDIYARLYRVSPFRGRR